MCGLAKNIGYCNVFNVELWGVFEGLKFAHDKGFTKVEMQIDGQEMVNVIQDNIRIRDHI